MSPIEIFLSVFGGTGAALAVAAFLGKKFVNLRVSQAIEKYKAELEQKSALLKTELSIYAHEQNVGITRIDQQRSDAIRSIYGLAMKWHDILMEITKPNEPKIQPEISVRRYFELSKALVQNAEGISELTRDNAIFFQQDSYKVIAKFGSAAMDLSCAFHESTFGSIDMADEDHPEKVLNIVSDERKTLLVNSRKDGFDQARQLLAFGVRPRQLFEILKH